MGSWGGEDLKHVQPIHRADVGLYYNGVLYVGSSLTLAASAGQNASTYSLTPLYAFQAGSALTAPPNPATSPSVQAQAIYGYVS